MSAVTPGIPGLLPEVSFRIVSLLGAPYSGESSGRRKPWPQGSPRTPRSHGHGRRKWSSRPLDASSALPSEQWLLVAHPDEDDDGGDSSITLPTFDPSVDPRTPAPEDQKDRNFRQSPMEKLIHPLIVNIAGAVGSLPELKRLDVSTGPRRAFSIVYYVDERLLEIQANPKFGPEEKTMVAWKNASRAQIGSGHILKAILVRANVEGPQWRTSQKSFANCEVNIDNRKPLGACWV